MPYSYPLFKDVVRKHITDSFHKNIKILDVGAGSGVWSDLLYEDFRNMDALEIFQPYIEQFNLKDKYRNVFCADILKFDFSKYDYLIMGDVVEHIDVKDAYVLLSKINMSFKYCMVAVPYLYEQGIMYDNEYEIHKQPDLTHEIFLRRYPMMRTFCKDDKYGYYINYNPNGLNG